MIQLVVREVSQFIQYHTAHAFSVDQESASFELNSRVLSLHLSYGILQQNNYYLSII